MDCLFQDFLICDFWLKLIVWEWYLMDSQYWLHGSTLKGDPCNLFWLIDLICFLMPFILSFTCIWIIIVKLGPRGIDPLAKMCWELDCLVHINWYYVVYFALWIVESFKRSNGLYVRVHLEGQNLVLVLNNFLLISSNWTLKNNVWILNYMNLVKLVRWSEHHKKGDWIMTLPNFPI